MKAVDLPFWVFLRVAASAGARRSQICGLQWGDVDLDSARALFARAVVDGDNGIEIKGTKTDRVYRVALDAGSCEALRQHREWAEQIAEQAETALTPESFVFLLRGRRQQALAARWSVEPVATMEGQSWSTGCSPA